MAEYKTTPEYGEYQKYLMEFKAKRQQDHDYDNHGKKHREELARQHEPALSGTDENIDYLNQLAEFHKQHGGSLDRFPSVDKRPLDLFKLKRAVEMRGGFFEISKQKTWAEIGRDLGYSGKIISSLSTSLKNSYQKWLHPYEEYLQTLKIRQAVINEEDGGTIKCICGFLDDVGSVILCEMCDRSQHIVCYYENRDVPDIHECVDCSPRQVDSEKATALQRQLRNLPKALSSFGFRIPKRSRDRHRVCLFDGVRRKLSRPFSRLSPRVCCFLRRCAHRESRRTKLSGTRPCATISRGH
ncbi:ARID-domain-containing protein [Mytilinidion resinicola]|uniref:ARID-domain-containing protein n=1 Tax=Mytilinidion resinicola TaxID=574789 RepID=A0A6A6YN81_9PEZI|nr:ARID-domain-containing protein [Mytilinidion resinicola]KAF2809464.1 ARID-domain-containing protein [Mytilinidion resinicola]